MKTRLKLALLLASSFVIYLSACTKAGDSGSIIGTWTFSGYIAGVQLVGVDTPWVATPIPCASTTLRLNSSGTFTYAEHLPCIGVFATATFDTIVNGSYTYNKDTIIFHYPENPYSPRVCRILKFDAHHLAFLELDSSNYFLPNLFQVQSYFTR